MPIAGIEFSAGQHHPVAIGGRGQEAEANGCQAGH